MHISVKDEAWISDVATVLQKGEIDTIGIITWGGFNSQCMNEESVEPRDQIVILPLLSNKAASLSVVICFIS